jgi:hypothetical protein
MNYVKGDLFAALKTQTQEELQQNPILVAHCCNDIGAWGAGFVLALSKFNPLPEQLYKLWANEQRQFWAQMGGPPPKQILPLGRSLTVPLDKDSIQPSLWVANIIGQRGIRRDQQGNPPIRYSALHKGLQEAVNETCNDGRAWRLWAPKMGAGLAGGDW